MKAIVRWKYLELTTTCQENQNANLVCQFSWRGPILDVPVFFLFFHFNSIYETKDNMPHKYIPIFLIVICDWNENAKFLIPLVSGHTTIFSQNISNIFYSQKAFTNVQQYLAIVQILLTSERFYHNYRFTRNQDFTVFCSNMA